MLPNTKHSIDERFCFFIKKKNKNSHALMLLLGVFSSFFSQLQSIFFKKTKLVNSFIVFVLCFLLLFLKKRKIKYENLFFYFFYFQ
jgi:O-antigen ligase